MEVDYPQVEQASTTPAPPQAAKPAPSMAHIAELKSGKVIWKQKPLSCDKLSETLQEIMSFRSMIESLDDPLETFPESYHPIIAKLVHGSDKTIATLAKNVQQELLPPTIDESLEDGKETPPPVVPLEVVEKAIQFVATRVNWGIDNGVAAVCVWRWEVNDRSWLPKQIQDKAESRYQERLEAKKALAANFDALSEPEQNAIMKRKAIGRTRPTADGDGKENAPGTSKKQRTGRLKKSEIAVGKDAPEGEKEKTAKVEKTKKDEAWSTGRSATMFSAWLSKPTVKPSTSESKPTNIPAPTISDFERSFRPFAVRKNIDLAPNNYFKEQAETKKGKEIIELDDDGQLVNASARPHVKPITPYPKGSLLPFGGPSTCPSTSYNQRSGNSRVRSLSKQNVKELMSHITEAAEEGDYTTTSDLAKRLADRKFFPLRFMHFSHEGRPEYVGTWTKSSATVGPRTPFAKDTALDYEAEGIDAWLEEEESEADDVASLDEDEDIDEDGGSEDDWIVSDDVVELVDGAEMQGSPHPSLSPLPPVGKRKGEYDERMGGMKRRKIITAFVPEIKGPIWEPTIGECTRAFERYQIRLLNDTPYPIDPFTFIPDIRQRHKPTSSSGQTKTADGFVIPALPDHIKLGDGSTSANGTTPAKKRGPSQPVPKTTIPDSLLPEFVAMVHGATSNRPVLVDEVYQALKDRGVKKNAVEAKFKEIAVKEKGTKKWVVSEEVRKSVGLA